jgi:methionyl-tRNA formyltransferase
MRIVLCCATRRGLRCLEALHTIAPDAELVVVSFREESWEPPFLEAIQQQALSCGAEFFETRQVGRLSRLWEGQAVDLMLAVSWRYLIPGTIYRRAQLGAYVIHDSLLPAYRGFSPTVWSMMNGEDHTGATLLEMVDDYDAGAVIGQERVEIGSDEAIAAVLENVTAAYVRLLQAHVPALLTGRAVRSVQDESQATYTVKLLPEDFRIDWSWPTARIYNLVRATTAPYPGAHTTLDGKRLTIWAARRREDSRRYVGRLPGRVAEIRAGEGVVVLTGDGTLLVTEVQLADGERVPAAQVLERMTDTLI